MSYNKISNWVGRNDNFLAKARKLPILPTSLDIYLIYDKTIYVFCIPSIEFFFSYSAPKKLHSKTNCKNLNPS